MRSAWGPPGVGKELAGGARLECAKSPPEVGKELAGGARQRKGAARSRQRAPQAEPDSAKGPPGGGKELAGGARLELRKEATQSRQGACMI